MVQGERQLSTKSWSFDNSHKRAGFEAIQKREEAKKEMARRDQEKAKYGAWGPVFKDRDNFASMHFC